MNNIKIAILYYLAFVLSTVLLIIISIGFFHKSYMKHKEEQLRGQSYFYYSLSDEQVKKFYKTQKQHNE